MIDTHCTACKGNEGRVGGVSSGSETVHMNRNIYLYKDTNMYDRYKLYLQFRNGGGVG